MKRAMFCAAIILAAAPTLLMALASQNCFWPTTKPRCSSWFITEPGLYMRFTDRYPGDETLLLGYSFGWMRNVSTRSAWGGELFGGVEGEVRGGLALRARRWLSGRAAMDVVVGAHLFGDASSQSVAAGSPMFGVRITHADKLAAVARLDVLNLRCGANCDPTVVSNPNGTSTRFYAGIELGSQPGAVGAALAAVAVGVWAASCCD
jgi:hypothetical protein